MNDDDFLWVYLPLLKFLQRAHSTKTSLRSSEQIYIAFPNCPSHGCYVCIVLGYCEGGDMAEAIKRANGVHFPEECSNIFLTKDQDIRLGDFGLAKMLTSDDLASSVVGTPSYMCPELLADIPYGSKLDIWSLGCCIYEMATHKAAFKAFAADLLRHPHLQPYILKIHLKSNSPRRNTSPAQWSDSNTTRKTRLLKPEAVTKLTDRERRQSYSNDRALNPSISGTELDSPCSSQRARHCLRFFNKKFSELSSGSVHEDIGVEMSTAIKFSSAAKTPRLTPAKTSATPRRQIAPPKISNIGENCDSISYRQVPVTRSLASKPFQPTRRASLPLSTRATTFESPYNPNASSEEPMFSICRPSSTSAHCCTTSPTSGDRSITKDKCTVQILDRTFAKPCKANANRVDPRSGSECSEQNPTTVVSSRSSSDSRQRRFDTSSYQQRAEALEGLLKFSAQLLHQERFNELGVLLKPFGPGKVSPRETAIWLTKSFKETVV
ncbi:Serine/threonine-protein kinase Nek2 [Camellia lanceoleosa]|uniref:Serine/threonine-protein kinase Nek2 n=1 Tax=Camellia lanceoleosa TaxID=1840588 RepID=A0ACC0GK94_9ERIC|nr:Serine/threonine-protein kinase Nek2 [Camellia lanceoleosa]